MTVWRSATQAQLSAIEKQIEQIGGSSETLRDKVYALEARIATLELAVADLKQTGQEWGRRGWNLGQALLIAVVGGVIGYLLER